jgi:sugar/nucleoside kinase (ribokinase family)
VKILGIQRFELLVADPEAEARRLSDLLGFEFESSVTEEHGVLSFTDWGAGLELAGPSRADSALTPRLEERGEGFLTVVYRVDSIDDLVQQAREKGIDVVVDLDLGPMKGRFRSYRQVSLANEMLPGRASFTFAEYEEE